jgi:hypothetical protein
MHALRHAPSIDNEKSGLRTGPLLSLLHSLLVYRFVGWLAPAAPHVRSGGQRRPARRFALGAQFCNV